MKRNSRIDEGNDCIYGVCRWCPGKTGLDERHRAGHGIKAEEWIYWITSDDGLTSLSLVVHTDIYPPTVPADHAARCGVVERKKTLYERRYGTDLTLHVGFKTRKEQLAAGAGDGMDRDCFFLGEKRGDCSRTTALGAREFFEKHGYPFDFRQTEEFWKALEDRFVAMDREAREERVDEKYVRCNACDGTGVVAK